MCRRNVYFVEKLCVPETVTPQSKNFLQVQLILLSEYLFVQNHKESLLSRK